MLWSILGCSGGPCRKAPSDVEKVFADGAYESFEIFDMVNKIESEPVIPPRKDAKIRTENSSEQSMSARDDVVKLIDEIGRKEWKIRSQYHLRSISETAMFRFKVTFGPAARSRKFENQVVELIEKCSMLNILTRLGMPNSYML